MGAATFGIGGDRIEHLAWRLRESGIGTTFTPAVAVVLIGVNNLASDTVEDIALGTTALIDQLQKAALKPRILSSACSKGRNNIRAVRSAGYSRHQAAHRWISLPLACAHGPPWGKFPHRDKTNPTLKIVRIAA